MANLSPENLLVPSFDRAYWRSRQYRRFRDFPAFSRKKGHFEPEDHNPFAARWAEELSREESAEEIRQVYENAVVIFRNRRSAMERTERSLDCPQFRFGIESTQDPEDHARVRLSRELWIKIPLDELPEHFDDLFPWRPDELVVPVEGNLDRRRVLEALEDWEQALRGKLSESADQTVYRVRFPNGLAMAVNLAAQETVFTHDGVAGVLALGPAIAQEFKRLGLRKRLP